MTNPVSTYDRLPQRDVEIAGFNVHFADAGDGFPVVLVHGSPTSSLLFRHQIAALSREYRVVAPDLLGFGRSAVPAGGTAFRQQAEVLRALLDHLGLERYALLGHDWGGPIAMACASRRLDRVSRLVLVNTSLRPDFEPPWYWKPFVAPLLGELLLVHLNLFGRGLPLMMRAAKDRSLHRRYRIPMRRVDTRRTVLALERLTGYAELMAEVQEALPKLEVPTLILWGQPDACFSASNSRLVDVQCSHGPTLSVGAREEDDDMAKLHRRWAASFLAAALLFLLVPTRANAWCWWNCSYAKTRYPIVLAHGFLGADTYLGILDYWYGIESYIEDKGGTVYVTEVSPANSSANRGEQLIDQLEEIRAIRGDPNLKFNLIGHSQGGLDVRYVAGVRPDLVASLTTVGAPHLGVDLVDQFGGGLEGLEGLVDFLGNAVSLLWGLLGNDNPNDMLAALEEFSSANMAAFNADPIFGKGMPASYCGDGEAVSQTNAGPRRNYSWTGDEPTTNILDVLDPLFFISSLLFDERNDGLVEACSAHFGDVLRDNYRMNHLDEVNQLLGLTALFETNPKSVYRTHANRLKNAGL